MNGARNDGGAAFPLMPPVGADDMRAPGYPYPEEGMTLRDYFAVHAHVPGDISVRAAKAMTGELPPTEGEPEILSYWMRVEAAFRYAQADAMLSARSA